LSSIASKAALTDLASAVAVLKAMTDPVMRVSAVSTAIESALKKDHPGDAFAFVDLVSDEDFHAVWLGSIMNYGIDYGDISEVLPRVIALKDPKARAWLLVDALRSGVSLKPKTGNTDVLVAATAAVAAMPDGFWQTRLSADVARFAGKLDPAVGQKWRDKTLASARALSGEDAAHWQRYVEAARKANESAAKSSAGSKEEKLEKGRLSALDEWTSLLQSDYHLNAPLFTDFKTTMDGLANSVPSSADNKAGQLFSNVQQQAQRLITALQDVHELRKKVAADMATLSTVTAP
jgi:hypothetical protein